MFLKWCCVKVFIYFQLHVSRIGTIELPLLFFQFSKRVLLFAPGQIPGQTPKATNERRRFNLIFFSLSFNLNDVVLEKLLQPKWVSLCFRLTAPVPFVSACLRQNQQPQLSLSSFSLQSHYNPKITQIRKVIQSLPQQLIMNQKYAQKLQFVKLYNHFTAVNNEPEICPKTAIRKAIQSLPQLKICPK